MTNYVSKIIHLDNGNSFEYVNYMNNGTWFKYGQNINNEGWEYRENEKLWSVLSSLVHSGRRIRIWYGDPKTGRSRNENYDVIGTIGRSRGSIAIPLLINNSRSNGGSSLLDDCIIRIDDIKTRRTLYRHADFHVEKMTVEIHKNNGDYPFMVFLTEDSGAVKNIANFKTWEKAKHWIEFMNGWRYRT